MPAALFVSGRRAPQLPSQNAPIYHLPEAEFVEQTLQRYQGIPDVILQDPELLKVFLPAIRADTELTETYVFREEPPLDCPIVAFSGLEDDLSRDDLEAWREQTTREFRLHMLPGDHFFLRNTRSLFLQHLSRELSRIRGL